MHSTERMARLRIWRRTAFACLSLLLTVPVGAQVAPAGPPRPAADSAPRTGVIAGIVVDPARTPLADVSLTVDGTAIQARSGADGRFVLEGVRAGAQSLVVRRIGSRPLRTTVQVRADSAIVLAITLAGEAQQLPGVVVEEQIFNQLGGVVVDGSLRAVPGAVIDVMGLRRQAVTDAEGRFLFVDLPPGQYMLEVRATGYALARRGVQMAARIQRDFAIRLHSGVDARIALEVAAVVAQEADRRKSLAGARAAFVGRDELDRWGDADLLVALMGSSGAMALRETGAPRPTRGPTSITSRGTSSAFGTTLGGGSSGSPLSCVLVDGYEVGTTNLLGFFRASDVELVEIFPAGAENSRTLCGRFPPSTGCSCPPDPAGVVVWLRK